MRDDGVLTTIARACLAAPFLRGGFDALRDPGKRPTLAAQLGLPESEVLVRVNGAAMVAGGAALVVGVLPRAAAVGLIVSMVPTTLAGHRFWEIGDPAQRSAQRTQFLKNLGLIGGLLLVAGDG
jgi:putative oxidoreductase